MKELSKLLSLRKREFKQTVWDDKSIFFAFRRIIKEEYGSQGEKNLVPTFLKNKKLFIKAGSSNWANELYGNRSAIIEKINSEINSYQVDEIKLDY